MAFALVDFASLNDGQRVAAARILRDALAHMPSAYNAPGQAEDEVERCRSDPDWLGYAALDQREVLGWIGATQTYSHAWEVHPLVVTPERQRSGIGSALMMRLAARARADGILTLYVGSDDDYGGTNLFGQVLFPGALDKAAAVQPSSRGHAIGFYRRQGFEVVGVIPDANGPGKADILLARSLQIVGNASAANAGLPRTGSRRRPS